MNNSTKKLEHATQIERSTTQCYITRNSRTTIMTIEVVRHAAAKRWVRVDQQDSPNLQSSSMQTDQSWYQNSVGVNCRMGKTLFNDLPHIFFKFLNIM